MFVSLLRKASICLICTAISCVAQSDVQAGIELVHQGKFPDALKMLRQALKQNPKSAEAHNYLGFVLGRGGDLSGAIAEFEKALSLDPKYAEAFYNLGCALRLNGQTSEAIVKLRQALELRPGFFEAELELGITLARSGDPLDAVPVLRKAIQDRPSAMSARNELGLVYEQLGDSENALRQFRQAVQIDPRSPESLNNLGVALHKTGDLDGAIDSFRKATAARSDFGEAWKNLAQALRDKGDLAGAMAAYRKLIELEPKSAAAHADLGSALRRGDRTDEAAQELQLAVEVGPKPRTGALSACRDACTSRNDGAGSRRVRRCIRIEPTECGIQTPIRGRLGEVRFSQSGAGAAGSSRFESDAVSAYRPWSSPAQVRGRKRRLRDVWPFARNLGDSTSDDPAQFSRRTGQSIFYKRDKWRRPSRRSNRLWQQTPKWQKRITTWALPWLPSPTMPSRTKHSKKLCRRIRRIPRFTITSASHCSGRSDGPKPQSSSKQD